MKRPIWGPRIRGSTEGLGSGWEGKERCTLTGVGPPLSPMAAGKDSALY